MEAGRVSETVWKRAVLRPLQRQAKGREEKAGSHLLLSQGETCGIVFTEGAAAEASAFVAGDFPEAGFYAAAEAMGELAAKGAEPEGISVRFFLSPESEEKDLERFTETIAAYAAAHKIPVLGVQAEVTGAVSRPVTEVRAMGSIQKIEQLYPPKLRPGQEILHCGYAGLSGSLCILEEAEEELRRRYVPAFLAKMKEQRSRLDTEEAIRMTQQELHPPFLRQIKSGGIFAALWDLTEEAGTGMEISLENINLLQETVEVCEYYRINPYQMVSAGSFLLVTEEGEKALHMLERQGVKASRLGAVSESPARKITNGTEVRYLDRPAPDAYAQWQAAQWKEQKNIC